jgi:hypothetical protein
MHELKFSWHARCWVKRSLAVATGSDLWFAYQVDVAKQGTPQFELLECKRVS